MINKIFALAPAAMVVLGLAGGAPLRAQTTPACYTLESMQGSFAVIGTYGANIAIALGVRNHDANGNIAATFLNNQPVVGSPTGERSTVAGTNRGSFTMNCDGTGVVTRVATANGVSTPAFDDFLITEGAVVNGKLVAMAVTDMQRIPAGTVPGGVFLVRRYVRRPEPSAGCYTHASLQGSYSVEVNYGVNAALGLQPETFDGKGNLLRTGVLNQPDTTSTTGARIVGPVTSTGTYTVTCEGRGTFNRVVTRPDGTQAVAVDDFLITQGEQRNGVLVATRIVDAQRDPSVILPGGVFVTRLHTLRPSLTVPVPTAPGATKTIAVAGPKNLTATSRSISLDGTASTSADGKALQYFWTMAQGSPVGSILGGSTATPTVQFSQGRGIYTFLLTVTDSTGATAQDTVTVDYRGN